MPLISIITPVYNSERFLEDTMRSVFGQTFTDWEWLLVNDASTDGSAEVLAKMAADPRVHVFHNDKNRGAGACRNLCIRAAAGRYLAFLDADDIWKPEKLERQLAFMRRTGAAVSHTAYCFLSEQGDVRGRVDVLPLLTLPLYMQRTEISGSTGMLDRARVGRVRFVPTRNREDTLLWISLFRRGFLSYGLDEALTFYRTSRTQTTRVGNLPRMVWQTFCIFWGASGMPRYKVISYFCCYVINACKKRFGGLSS